MHGGDSLREGIVVANVVCMGGIARRRILVNAVNLVPTFSVSCSLFSRPNPNERKLEPRFGERDNNRKQMIGQYHTTNPSIQTKQTRSHTKRRIVYVGLEHDVVSCTAWRNDERAIELPQIPQIEWAYDKHRKGYIRMDKGTQKTWSAS